MKTWLLAIVWRQALSHRRSVVARLRRFVAAPGDEPFDPPSGSAPPDRRAADIELQRHVARVMRSLPSKYREALMLSATGDHTFEEMSAMLGVPAGTLKWRVAEARRRLREKLARLGVTT